MAKGKQTKVKVAVRKALKDARYNWRPVEVVKPGTGGDAVTGAEYPDTQEMKGATDAGDNQDNR